MNGNQWYRYVMAGLMCLCGVARYAGAATIEIATVEELQKIGNEGGWPLSGTYILTNDIDASETETWNEGMGFDPIGDYNADNSFHIDGQGYVIKNLYINRPDKIQVGLTVQLSQYCSITNLGLEDCTIIGKGLVGGFSSRNSGPIRNCYLKGTTVKGEDQIGGITGENRSELIDCYVEASFVEGSQATVGGLMALNYGTISNCHVHADVKGETKVGGFIGNNQKDISNCYSEGTVTATGGSAGGFIAQNFGPTINDCFSTASVAGTEEVGGLIGTNDGSINDCYATGSVTGSISVGGLIGSHQRNTVNRCYATGDVRGIETDAFSYSADVGGLIGTKEMFDNEAIDCYASGNVTSTSNGYSFGGLVGFNDKGDIRRCYAVGSVACRRYGGGLAGSFSGGNMNSCFARGTVVTEEYDAGGLIGYNGGIITDCYAWASVKGALSDNNLDTVTFFKLV